MPSCGLRRPDAAGGGLEGLPVDQLEHRLACGRGPVQWGLRREALALWVGRKGQPVNHTAREGGCARRLPWRR